ncbi:uncharacterized protein [Drosophila kikkawai]|uniref:Uncharacterized protein isoform X2 n=1 Tax=Drosophila kikkawai TaxID=30033 RepID=A0A6P4IVJ3_DROKI|nr:uncharacterized protein LOC108077533 isoform X2 [Drosophila kikkawai]
MEIIFTQDVHNVDKFLSCAEKLHYDEFSAQMFAFCNGHCDMDVFELMGNDRLAQLLYGWEVCRVPSRDVGAFKEPALRHLVLVLAHHSLQMWFSQEWITCSDGLKNMLLYSLTKAVPAFYRIEELANINWAYVLKFQASPWSVPYLQQLFLNLRKNKHHAIEHAVAVATIEDITFLKDDGLNLILLRLMQLFNAGNFEAVKQLSLRMLAAWLKANEYATFEAIERDKSSIALVGHLYLLTVFTMDENRGYAIDNLMYNIRFYAQSMQEHSPISEHTHFTPARLIAQVCVRLRMGKTGFFEQISFKKFKLNLVTSFAVMLEAYTSYVLGNQLVELMALNEHDFLEHSSQFKELMHRYVAERESSERFLLEELKKLENQRNSHFQPQVVKFNINYQQQICKGNRASNIGNYKNCDDDEKPLPPESDEELDRQIDPVFQSVPNNEEILDFVYKLLAEREFSGWKFAKIAILLKIIGQQLNAIEIWRYHPGLTTEFMLNLEQKMSQNYADLAKVFSDHGFMEAEFWLTAFYLNPISVNYNEVRRCSRIKKKRQEEDHWTPAAAPSQTIKYELLSSTIDVDEIVTVTNHNAPVGDYDPIYKALQALRLPPSMIKDLLTVVFQPRNKRYSWALDWYTLHERCHALLKSRDLKNKFVALNMAEASDRLEYLKIDYAKYRDRPQLDYGTIEEGYENAANLPEPEEEPEQTPTATEEEDVKSKQQKKRRPTRKFWDEVFSEDEEEEAASSDSEAYYTGNGRRKRVRAAAMVANAMLSDMDRSVRCGRRSSSPALSDEFRGYPLSTIEVKQETETKPSRPPSTEEAATTSDEKRTIGDLLEARTKFSNETGGFKAFADIWSFEKEELQNVASEGNSLMECSSVLSKFKSWKSLKETVAAKVPPVEPQPTRRAVRTGSETESISSEASSMATHYFNEDEPSDDLLSGVSRELATQPLPPVPKLTSENQVLQPTETNTVGLTEQPLGSKGQLVEDASPKTAPQTEQPQEELGESSVDTRQIKEELIEDIQATEESQLSEEPEENKQTVEGLMESAEETVSSQVKEEPDSCEQVKEEPVSCEQQTQDTNHLKNEPQLSEEPQQPGKQSASASKTTSETGTETGTAEETRCDDIAQKPEPKLEPIGQSLYTLVPPDETPDEKKVREHLINECLTRPIRVCLKMLTVQDIEKLRGVRVRVKRTNLEDFYREQSQSKRRRILGSRSHTEDSTASNHSSDAQKSGRRRFKKFVHITSDSVSPSPPPRIVDIKPLFKHITSDSSTDLEEVPHPVVVVRRRGRGRGRGAGPRCIRAPRHSPSYSPDVIELSSDSLSSNSPVPAASHPMHQFSALEMDPLYEEEIVPI